MYGCSLDANLPKREHKCERVYIESMKLFRDLKFCSFGLWINLAVTGSYNLNFNSYFERRSNRYLFSSKIWTISCLSSMLFRFAKGCTRLALSILIPP